MARGGKVWATPSRWRDLLWRITKQQGILEVLWGREKIALPLLAVQCIYYSIFLSLSNINCCGCNKMTNQLLNKVSPVMQSLRARFTGAFQALRVPGSRCAFIFQDCLPEGDLGQTAWASRLASHKDSQGTTIHGKTCLSVYHLPPPLQLA